MKILARRLLIGVLVLCGIFLGGCQNKEISFEKGHYEVPIEEIKTLNIDVQNRKIKVVADKDSKIHLTYYENKSEAYHIEVSPKHVLTLKENNQKDMKDYFGSQAEVSKRTIVVAIPTAQLANLMIKTTNENLEVDAIAITNKASLSVNNGELSLAKLNVGKGLTLTNKNGNIRGSVVGSYNDFAIKGFVKKGKNNLPAQKNGGAKTLTVKANNGDINLKLVQE